MRPFYPTIFLAFCLALVAEPQAANAQADAFKAAHADFFHVLKPDTTEIEAGYLYQPETKEDGGPGKYDLSIISAGLEIPFAGTRDFFMRAAADYEYRDYDFSDTPTSVLKERSLNLHRGLATFGMGLFLNDNALFEGEVSVGAFSDFDRTLKNDDIEVYGSARAVIRLNPGAQLIFGVASDETFEDYPVYPIFGVRMQSETGKFFVSITAPREAQLTYRFNRWIELYGGGWTSGDNYQATIDDQRFRIRIEENRAGGGFSFWLGQHVNLKLEAGALLGSTFKFERIQKDVFKGDLDPTAYASAQFGIAL